MQKISLCITNYNRVDMLIESFLGVLNDDRIDEIVISDDHSSEGKFAESESRLLALSSPKVKLFRNEQNIGMSLNKKMAIELASNEWCILLDSDNVIGTEYIDAIININHWKPDVIYLPDFAKPDFDYRVFSGLYFHKENIHEYIDKRMFDCMLNTCNYFVNREKYLEVYRHDPQIKAADTIQFNYHWIAAGKAFYVVKDMQYFHRVHPGSGFLENTDFNLKMAEGFKQKMKLGSW